MFFSFDGIDGAGKSTQMKLFCDWLRDAGHQVVSCRDPGSTSLGEAIRKIVLTADTTPIDRMSEMLLYMAARAQLVAEVIRPALAEGKTVVSDRYLLANIVYQGYAGGLDVETVRQVGSIVTGDLQPTLTFLLDMSVQQTANRLDRSLDRMEAQGTQYLEKVRQGFLQEAANRPDEIVIIDASREIEIVQANIQSAAKQVFVASQKL